MGLKMRAHFPAWQQQGFKPGPCSHTFFVPEWSARRRTEKSAFFHSFQNLIPKMLPYRLQFELGEGQFKFLPMWDRVSSTKFAFAVGWQHAIRQAEGFSLPWHCLLQYTSNTTF